MTARRVFLIGIGGSGMEPLAKFALQAGDRVSGSDSGLSDERHENLKRQGARIFREHAADNLKELFDESSSQTQVQSQQTAPIVVYSSAIPDSHVELLRARELADRDAVRLMHRMDFLNECLRATPEALCVAGTHGKTSSSSMAGWVLMGLGLDPHIIVGGKPLYLPDGVRFGEGQTGACETDESDGSFLKARPGLRLVLNIDHDHLENYGDFAALCSAFAQFVAAGRLCVLNAADPQLRAIGDMSDIENDSEKEIYYYHARSTEPDEPGDTELNSDADSFTDDARTYVGRFVSGTDRMSVTIPGAMVATGELQLKMPGRHFAGNALGVFALIDRAIRRGYLSCPDYDPRRALELLCEFPGVERRMQYLGRRGGATVYDDYGHHPTEIQAVIAACRVRLGAGRLFAVFQPHRYTRTAALYREFAAALRCADRVFLLPLYTAGETPIGGVGSENIARELEQLRNSARQNEAAGTASNDVPPTRLFTRATPHLEIFREVFAEVQPDDLVVCLGAGDISAGIREYFAATVE